MKATIGIVTLVAAIHSAALHVRAETYPWPKYEMKDFTTFTEYFDSMIPHIITGHDPSKSKEAYQRFRDRASVEIGQYLTHKNEHMRGLAFRHLYTFLREEKEKSRRLKLFESYLQGLGDEDGGMRQSVARRMNTFGADVFNAKTKSIVLAYLRSGPRDSAYEHIILAVGMIEAKEAIPAIKNIDHKCSSFALARMGDKEALAVVLSMFPKNPTVEDMTGRFYWDLKRLAYVKRPETVELLMRYLSSDVVKPGGNDYPPEYLAGWSAEAFVDLIGNVPIKAHVARRPESIEKCRKWLKANYDKNKILSLFPGEISRWK